MGSFAAFGLGPDILLGLTGGTVGCLLGTLAGLGKRSLILRKEVTGLEITATSEGRDTLTREYLQTVRMVLSLPTPDAVTARTIREAVRCLGEAVGRLPPPLAPEVSEDSETLALQAARLGAQAQGEADAVVAASLERQAQALRGRAETIARIATLARRHQVLREEIAAQVGAFRTSLAAAQVNGIHGSSDFTTLAESVAQVAQEANALADARAELDAALEPPRRIAAAEEETLPLENSTH